MKPHRQEGFSLLQFFFVLVASALAWEVLKWLILHVRIV